MKRSNSHPIKFSSLCSPRRGISFDSDGVYYSSTNSLEQEGLYRIYVHLKSCVLATRCLTSHERHLCSMYLCYYDCPFIFLSSFVVILLCYYRYSIFISPLHFVPTVGNFFPAFFSLLLCGFTTPLHMSQCISYSVYFLPIFFSKLSRVCFFYQCL